MNDPRLNDVLVRFYLALQAAMPPGECHLTHLGDTWRIAWRGTFNDVLRTGVMTFDRDFLCGIVGDVDFCGRYHAQALQHRLRQDG